MGWPLCSTGIVIAAILTSSQTSGSRNICETPGCVHTAKVILNNMDAAVDPCQDFYKFACGGFLNATTIPEDRNMWTVTSDMELAVMKKLSTEFNSTEGLQDKPRFFRQAHSFHQSCMDTDRLEERNLSVLVDKLEVLGGWPVMDLYGGWDEDEFHWVNMTLLLADEGWNTDMLVDMCLGTDARDSNTYRIELSQADLGIPREYLIQGVTNEVVQTYTELMVDVAVQLGVPYKDALEELSNVVMFECELAKISVPQEEMRDHFRLYNPMTLNELGKHYPYANWSHLITTYLEPFVEVSPDEVVNVVVPSYFEKLGGLLERVDKRVVANYMLWHVVYESLPFLPQRVAHLRRNLMTVLTGATRFRPRWEFCLSSLADRFEHVVGATYVRTQFSPRIRHKATQMVKAIHQEFQELIRRIPWMCKETREIALKKASNIFYHVGYPSELMDDEVLDSYYGKLNIESDDLLVNMLSAQRFESFRVFSQLHKPVNKTSWETHAEVAEVNAYYITDQNAIEIPAGILQDIFFSHDRPNYLNFGAIGHVIAHELTHSVDDEGKQYDHNGNLKNWWEWSTHKEFDSRAQDIVKEYSKYKVAEINMTLKGVNVQGEVIADHGGVKVAHSAYHSWAQHNLPEPRLPRLTQYSPNQLFWLAVANTWCSRERDESLRLGVMVDPHPPAEFRVNGPFRHSVYFAADWSCPIGSYMNPSVKYNVW